MCVQDLTFWWWWSFVLWHMQPSRWALSMVAGKHCLHLQISSINAYYKNTWHQHRTQYEVNKCSLGNYKRRRLHISVGTVRSKLLFWGGQIASSLESWTSILIMYILQLLLFSSARVYPQLLASAYLGVLSQSIRHSQHKAVHSPPSLRSLFHTHFQGVKITHFSTQLW